MLIWRGWGIGALLIAATVNGLMLWLAGLLSGDSDFVKTHQWLWLISMSLAGGCTWFVGAKLESKPGQLVVDKATGREIELKSKHDLLFIPFKYWGVIFLALGISYAFGS